MATARLIDSTACNVTRVQQEDPHGCVLACIAMATGRTYAEVRALFQRHDFQSGGLNLWETLQALAFFGFALRVFGEGKYSYHPERERTFAPLNIANVVSRRFPQESHMVVVLGSGEVIDPSEANPHGLSSYREVIYVAGLYKVAEWPAG